MSKLTRPIAVTAACLAVIGFGTTGVAAAAAGNSPHGSPAAAHDRGHHAAALNHVQGSRHPALRPTSIALKATKSAVAPNQKVTLTGFLKSGHTPVTGAPVMLEKRATGAKTFTVVSTKTTDSNGKITLVVTPGTRTGQKVQYELAFAGNTTYRGSHSQIITLTVG